MLTRSTGLKSFTHLLPLTSRTTSVRLCVRNEQASVAVNTALLHGAPFRAWPRWRHYGTSRCIEIGDLLVAGEWHEPRSRRVVREALLLQMKVGTPSLGGAVRGTKAQAELYATWPPFNWSKKLRSGLPGVFPRTPEDVTSEVSLFGIIPEFESPRLGSHLALRVRPGPVFGEPDELHSRIGRVLRLDTGVDATPARGCSGWARIVQDILQAAPKYRFRGQQRFASALGPLPQVSYPRSHDDDVEGWRESRARDRRFAIVQVGFGPQGILD